MDPITLHTPLTRLAGVGPARAAALAKLGLKELGDLLAYFPREYEDRTLRREGIPRLPADTPVCFSAVVAEPFVTSRIRKGMELTKGRIVDGSGQVAVTFFHQSYVRQMLHPGQSYYFYGKLTGLGPRRQMVSPQFEPEGKGEFTGGILPVYPLTAGISNRLLISLVRQALPCLDQVEETLPEDLRRQHRLVPAAEAYLAIHFPPSWDVLARARRRLVFEELFCLNLGLTLLRRRRAGQEAIPFSQTDLTPFTAALPFPLTRAQARAAAEAAADMAQGVPMNRLLQGDVGSGKTVVAAACAYLAWRSGCQAALMAPTELLAQQHLNTMTGLLGPFGLRIALLSGSMTAAQKRACHAALAAGEIDLIIGTHALISPQVEFHRLALIVADEQHRFGVAQRAALAGKSETGGMPPPHVLVMSATPIPRTLALIIYGDLDVSVIDELPPGRTPVETYVVREDKRARMYNFVRRLVGEGRQVYIICPAVEENTEGGMQTAEWEGDGPALDLKAVTTYAKKLQTEVFPDLRVDFLHGKMKPREKEAVMAAFAAGETQVLVSTTVIEVGVDVPNAALIIIENAERFGLSQLHQLRGRVGRGKHQSYCVLITSTRSVEAMQRLRTLASTTDGFKISEEDLKLRGPGDFFGSRQHGLPQMKLADLAGDMRLLSEAQESARRLLMADPTLSQPENRPVLERVRTLFADTPDIFN